MQPLPKIELVFYRTGSGSEPVRDWLISLDRKLRHAVGTDLRRVQYGWPIGMPLVRPLGKGLFELRSTLPDRTIARTLFCFHGGEIYVLHGFLKKTRKLPQAELNLALERKRDVDNG